MVSAKEHRVLNNIKLYIEYDNFTKVNWEEIQKNSTKIPFIIMHGHTANRYYQYPLYNYFKNLNWPVLIFDLRGHGWSQKDLKKYRLKDTVEDLYSIYSEILLKEFGYKQFYLLGHSMGGAIAQLYALKYPNTLKKLILLSTSARFADNFALKIGMWLLPKLFRHNYDKWFEKKRKSQEPYGLDNFGHWEDKSLRPTGDSAADFLEDIAKLDLRGQIQNIKIPTYILVGSEDDVVPVRMSKILAEKIPNSKFEILNGYVHNIAIHAKDVLSKKIEHFLEN